MDIKQTSYCGIYELWLGKRRLLLTKSLDNNSYFKEKLIDGYREIDARRSKLAAAIVKKISFLPFKKGNKILYLGASHGYTPSFISDIVGENGSVFCIDFAPRVVRDLLLLCEKRNNMIPILANANKPLTYKDRIEKCDILYQDVAQRNQLDIFIKNFIHIKPRGYAILAVKTRSIDVTKNPEKIAKEIYSILSQKTRIIDYKNLNPLEKDHYFFVCQLK